MGPNSDIDLLVVKSGDYHRGALTDEIYTSAVLAPALHEGRLLHAA